MPTPPSLLPLATIRSYCAEQPIKRLSLFGSYLHGDFTEDSDVDLLVEFIADAKITYFDLFDLQEALQGFIGQRVDLLTPAALSPYFRDDVLAEAEVIYERK